MTRIRAGNDDGGDARRCEKSLRGNKLFGSSPSVRVILLARAGGGKPVQKR